MLSSPQSQAESQTQTTTVVADVDPQILTQIRQLTFVGQRSGEGYFDATGSKMVFQSEREPGNPFYQIYLMDLQSGVTERISPGQGKTTCSWIHPDGNRVLFSSTHLDPDLKKKVQEELDNRKAAVKAKYSWSFDPQFDLFEYNRKTKKYKQLTHELGYDAEGSYSPDGQWIAFASNRHGYPGPHADVLTDEDKKIFTQDSSYLMEIYLMKADGTQARRLTQMRGYNGGPFFSADGKKITWRHFAPNGQTAEIWTMNADGTEQKQITHLGAMSWAPYFHPSGDYLIFSTNKLGFSNFELYIVDAKGEHEPVRASYLPDFDGLPVFSPDGNSLAWTHRNTSGDSQIFQAHWDDVKARQLLGLAQPGLRLADWQNTPEGIEQGLRRTIEFLAGDQLEGRATGSEAEKKYMQALANQMQEMGLVPADGKNFLQSYEYVGGVELSGVQALQLAGGKTWQVGDDFMPVSFSAQGQFQAAPVAFAGFGLVAPAQGTRGEYDSYRGLDVKGKWVLVLPDRPDGVPPEQRLQLNPYVRLQHKAMLAREKGAVGLLVVRFAASPLHLKFEGAPGDSSLPVISINERVADQILQKSGRTAKKWQEVLDSGEIQNTSLDQVQVSSTIGLKIQTKTAVNLLARLPASTKVQKGAVVIGAHGDHLGHGEVGNSLARGEQATLVHAGADDNASGVAGVLAVAHKITAGIPKNTKGLRVSGLKRDLVFAVWSGEEIGILGSSKFLEATKEPLFANLNMDMIGRLREQQLLVQGAGSAEEWRKWIEQLAPRTSLSLVVQDDPYLPTDSMAFYNHQVPTLNFFTGAHADYHSPRDTAEKINYAGLRDITNWVSLWVEDLGKATDKALHYRKVASSRSPLSGRSFRLYLGTVPDYTQQGVKGVRITGTSKDSPAEKAGLVAGDVIVELAGLKIENLYDYVYCLQSIKAGQATGIKIQREGQMRELNITPMLKE